MTDATRQGRGHPVGSVTIAAAVDSLVSSGFRPVARRADHLHAVAILEKLAQDHPARYPRIEETS